MRRRSATLFTIAGITLLAGIGALVPTLRASTEGCTISLDAVVSCPSSDDAAWAAVITSPLQPLVDSAAPGDTIDVGPGTYVGLLTFRGKNVTLRGAAGPELTILDGTGSSGAVVDIGPGGALTGFTVRNGQANFGGGMAVHGTGSLIRGNVFHDNTAFSGGFGAAISLNGASPLIERNTFRGNSCDGQYLVAVVSVVNASSPTIVDNVFEDNACRALSLTLPVGNAPVVIHNTIVRNPGGIRVDRRVDTTLHVYENNAIVDNAKGLQIEFGTDSYNPAWKNNLLHNIVNYYGISDQTGLNGNIAADPQFIDLAGGDYHLVLGSPAIDAGDGNASRMPATDYDGEVRARDGNGDALAVPDIGADEYTWRNRRPVAVVGADQTVECPVGPSVAVDLDGSASIDPDSTPGTNDDIVAFDWFDDFGSPSQAALGSGPQIQALLSGGTRHVTLRVTDHGGAIGTAALTVDVREPNDCDDGKPCTVDSITPTCGCNHLLAVGMVCDDGDVCTTPGVCDASGQCIGVGPVVCDDRNPCTVDRCEPAGCTHEAASGLCDDSNPCTTSDACVGSHCRGVHVPDGQGCDDHNDCTSNDACTSGDCYGVPVATGKSCDEHTTCTTIGFCRGGLCYGSPVADGTSCDDANPCTTGEACREGECVNSVPFVAAPGSPISGILVGVGDFDRDGIPDLVTMPFARSKYLVLRGDGAGGFTQWASVGSGSYRAVQAVADFNLDGNLDFVTQTDAAPYALVVYLGNGAGGFAAAPGPPTPTDSCITPSVTADFNNDGKPDLAATNTCTDTAHVFLGNGNGGFSARPPVAAGPYPWPYSGGVATGDFNRDGKLDLATANPVTNGGVVVLLGDGSGGLVPTAGGVIPAGVAPTSIAVGDFDQDGDQDLAVTDAGWAAGVVTILRGDGNGEFDAWREVSLGSDPYTVATADVDLDGQLDLVLGMKGTDAVQVWAGRIGGYKFARTYGSPINVPDIQVSVKLADLDRDGRPDILAMTESPVAIRVLLNRSVGRACPSIEGCATSTCDPVRGRCTLLPKFLDGACDDHNACTTNDSCIDGRCQGPGVTGIQCDDGSSCTSGDTCDEGVCAGAPIPEPYEVDSGVRLSRQGSNASVAWNVAAGATTSSVLRGDLGSLPVGSVPGDEACLVSRVPAPTATTIDTEVPREGAGFWYLVRGENACVAGPHGFEARNGFPVRPEVSSTCP